MQTRFSCASLPSRTWKSSARAESLSQGVSLAPNRDRTPLSRRDSEVPSSAPLDPLAPLMDTSRSRRAAGVIQRVHCRGPQEVSDRPVQQSPIQVFTRPDLVQLLKSDRIGRQNRIRFLQGLGNGCALNDGLGKGCALGDGLGNGCSLGDGLRNVCALCDGLGNGP